MERRRLADRGGGVQGARSRRDGPRRPADAKEPGKEPLSVVRPSLDLPPLRASRPDPPSADSSAPACVRSATRRAPEILPDPGMIEPSKIRFDPSLQAARPPGDQRAPQACQAACSPLPPWMACIASAGTTVMVIMVLIWLPLPLRHSEFAVRKAATAVIRLTSPTLPAAKFSRQRLTGFSNP